MNSLTEEEIKKLKNQFEIEERVVQILRFEGDIEAYNSKYRKTRPGQFTQERIKSSKARQERWNQLATSIAKKWFGLDNNNNDNNMTEQDGSPLGTTGDSSDITKLAEILKEVILAKTPKEDDFEFLERPKSYNGSRDPFIIESWIHTTLEDFADIKKFDNDKTAKVWYQNLRLLNSALTDWLHFKNELRAFFKPDNAISVARDRMRALRQKSTIAQYVQEFMTIKLSIPRLTEEDPELIAEDVLARIRDLKEKRFEAKEQMILQARKDKERWNAALKSNKIQTFEVGDYVMLRHESKKGL